MHLYAFVQAAEIWVKTESHSRGTPGLTLWWAPTRKKRTQTRCQLRVSSLHCSPEDGTLPPCCEDLTGTPCALRRALISPLRSKDARQLRREERRSGRGVCGGVAPSRASLWSPVQAADSVVSVFTSRRWFQLCALTCRRCKWTPVHPIQTPTSCGCWISPVTDSWHHGWSFPLCSCVLSCPSLQHFFLLNPACRFMCTCHAHARISHSLPKWALHWLTHKTETTADIKRHGLLLLSLQLF